MLIRFFIYGLIGWAADILWTGLPKKRPIDWRLQGNSNLWALPIYGQLAVLYEPAHDRLRTYPWLLRGIAYAFGFITVEFVAGELIRKLIGYVPWDHTPYTRWHIRGATRVDYLPLYFVFGMLLEPIHDYLVRLTPYFRTRGVNEKYEQISESARQ